MTFPCTHSGPSAFHAVADSSLPPRGIAGCGSDTSPDTMVRPAGLGGVPRRQHAKSATLTYIDNGRITSCAECHARTSPADSKVFLLREPLGLPPRPGGRWVAALRRPRNTVQAAMRAPATPASASARCCHGADFRTPRGDGNRTCYSCHSLAPHPDGPWRTSTGSTHTNTDRRTPPLCAVATGTIPRNARMFQQHAVPRPHRRGPGRGGPHRAVPGSAHTTTDTAGFATSCSAATRSRASRRIPRRLSARCCHQSAAALPFTNCTSCHARPPSGPSIRTSPAVTPARRIGERHGGVRLLS